MGKKYWEIIIEKSTKKLTLPYIIGAKKIMFPDLHLDTVETLLDEITRTNNDEIYEMYYCPDIGEYVIFLNRYKNYLIKGLEINSPSTGTLKMVFGMNMQILGKEYNQIKSKLAERYSTTILDNKFSYIERNWDFYTKKEIDEILSFIGYL